MSGANRLLLSSSEIGRKAWIDFAKGAAIIMVVYYHATLYLQHNGVEGLLGRAKAAFELYPMPAFFLIAGLFGSRIASWTFAELWRRRLAPLVYLYAVWSIIRAAFYFAVPGLNGELGEIAATNPLTLALLFVWPSSSYWFIYALLLFSFGAWLLRRVPPIVVAVSAAMVSTLFTMGLVDTQNVGWNRVGALFVFFIVGALYSERIFAAMQKTTPLRTAGLFVLFIGISAAILFLGLRWVPLVALSGQVFAVAFGLSLSTHLVRVRPLRAVSELGRQSLKIYLLHLFVIVPTAALIGLLSPEWPRPLDMAVHLVVVVGAIYLSLLLARLTSRASWLYVLPSAKRMRRRSSESRQMA